MPDLFEQFFADFDEDIGDHLTLQKLAPSYKIYFKDTDKAVRIYDQIENNRETFESLEPGSTDMLYTYLEKAKYQYEIAMAEFVPKNYDSLLDFFTWKMLTQGTKLHVFSKMHSYVKRYFKTDEMQKIMEYPLVFLGTAPKGAPALYNIMSRVDFGMGVFYPQGGIRAVIDAIVALAEDYQIEFRR
jgi:phytoene desaturase